MVASSPLLSSYTMFSEFDDYCTIGRPKGQLSSGDGDFRSPCLSKIGGVAQFHDSLSAPSTDDVICRVCKSSEKVVLVAQIYAPLDFHRSLYVFGCNNGNCSYNSSSWTVVRNQSDTMIAEGATEEHISNKSATIPMEEKKPVTATSWDAMNSFGDALPGQKSIVAAEDSDSEDDLADLMAMIAQRDNVPKKTEKDCESAVVTAAAAATIVASAGELQTPTILPCWRIAEVEEDWTKYDEAHNDDDNDEEGDEDDGSDAVLYTNKKGGIKSGADAHIEELLQSYLSTEDDAEVLSVFKKTGGASTSASKSQADGASKGSKKSSRVKSADVTNDRTEPEQEDDGAGAAAAEDEAPSEMKLSRSGDRARVEEYFLRRVGRYPSQVLRYAYGGQPLWITAPAPVSTTTTTSTSTTATTTTSSSKKGKASSTSGGSAAGTCTGTVPCCELCGAERVFECQLMPGLLSYVAEKDTKKGPVDNSTSSSTSNSSAATGSSVLRDFKSSELFTASGLDFGVVAIYSCPNSCSVKNNDGDNVGGNRNRRRIATEVAVVQLPPDVIDLY